jgi:2-amino-4-hydroxy-6-hydroxymethyldihydropteridine diphosphokinase
MSIVYFSLGSNEGNRFSNLQQALQYIELRIGTVEKISSFYETEPWGFEDETPFINQVIRVSTELSASKILERALLIEKQLGRQRIKTSQRYSKRTLDIDILFINNETISNDSLTVPHKHLHSRKFVLEPLCEIAADFIHPSLNQSISYLNNQCQDQAKVKKLKGKDILDAVA